MADDDHPVHDASGTCRTTPDGDRAACERPAEHLRDLPDGAGCTEIWAYLERRRRTDRGS